MKWKTKNGKEIEIKDMETTHIQNCIKMLEEKILPSMEEYLEMTPEIISFESICDTNDRYFEAKEKYDNLKLCLQEMKSELKKKKNHLTSVSV